MGVISFRNHMFYISMLFCTGTHKHCCKFSWCFGELGRLKLKYSLSVVHQVVITGIDVVRPFLHA